MTHTTDTLVGLVTDRTPTTLEYGDYRGYVRIAADTGECLGYVTDAERRSLTLGAAIYSEEYEDLRPEASK